MNRLRRTPLAISLLGLLALGAAAQDAATGPKVMREFRGVKLGLKTAEVRTALGKPESSDQARDEFKIGGEDTLTVYYDGGAVKTLQFFFTDPKNAPAWTEVVGDTEITRNDNGSKHARRVVSGENFWVAMYQNKEGTVTTITISR